MLTIKDSVISDKLIAIIKEEHPAYDSSKTFLILRSGISKDCYEIKIGFFNILDLPYYLKDKSDRILGYTECPHYTVLLFHESKTFPNELYLKSGLTKPFEIKLNETTKRDSLSKKRNVPPPDVPYEPIVRVYRYCLDTREMTLVEMGRFSLLY